MPHPDCAGGRPDGQAGHARMAARAARRAPWRAWPGKPGPSGRMNFRPSPSLPSSASQQPSSATACARTVLWGDEFAAKGRRMANTRHGAFAWQCQPAGKARQDPGTPRCVRVRPTATACTTWPAKSGSGLRLLHPAPPRSHPQGLLRTSESTRRPSGRDPGRCRPLPPPRHQGRVAPVRPELLPALPTRRPPGPIRGRRHLSSGLPLRASPTATGDQPRPPDWAPALSRILTQ